MNQVKIIHTKYPLKYDYFISDKGAVYSSKTNKVLNWSLDKDGYAKVRLVSIDNRRHRYSVHRLVLAHFAPVANMDELQVNHKDGNKLNNALSNLEWVTASENNRHKYQIGLASQSGENNNATHLTEKDVLEIISLLLAHRGTYKEIADKFHIHEETVGAIKRKKNWKYLTEHIDFN